MGYSPVIQQDIESIKQTARSVVEAGQMMSMIAETIGESGFQELGVKNWKMMMIALESIDNYNAALRSALIAARKERGDYEAKSVSAKKSSHRRKKD